MSEDVKTEEETSKSIKKLFTHPGLIGVLFGLLSGGLPSYFYLASETVNRQEMVRYVNQRVEEGPYIKDRNEIRSFMVRENDLNKDIAEQLGVIREANTNLRVALATLTEKITQLNKTLERGSQLGK